MKTLPLALAVLAITLTTTARVRPSDILFGCCAYRGSRRIVTSD